MNTQTGTPHFNTILVPLDGSTLAEEALPLAAQIARNSKAELRLLRVVPPSSCVPIYPVAVTDLTEPMREAAFTSARSYMEQAVARAHIDMLNVQTDVLLGGVASTIVDYASQQGVDLIVMRSHGETGLTRWIMGSTAQQLVRHSPVPVLIVNRPHNQPLRFQHAPRILVALDGSSLAEEAITPAALLSAALAHPSHGALHLTRIVQRLLPYRHQTKEQMERINREYQIEAEDYLKVIKQRLDTGPLMSLQLAITTSVVAYVDIEDVTKRILEESTCIGDVPGFTGCDIIAMSTHGRHGFEHLLLGSFTEEVFDAAQRPLLVVHARKLQNAEHEKAQRQTVDVPIIF